MTNNNDNDNRIELIGLNEFTQVTDAVRDVEEAVGELLAIIEEQKAEIKRLRAERDEARREVCDWHHTDESGCVKSGSEETAIKRGWDCFKNQETT